MTENPVTVESNASLETALVLMKDHASRHLIVMKDEHPACLIGVSDVLTALHEKNVNLISEMRGLFFSPPRKNVLVS